MAGKGETYTREEKKKKGSGRSYRGRGFTGSRFCFLTLRFYVIIYAVRCGSISTLRAIISLVVICTLEVLLYISVDRATKPYHTYHDDRCTRGFNPYRGGIDSYGRKTRGASRLRRGYVVTRFRDITRMFNHDLPSRDTCYDATHLRRAERLCMPKWSPAIPIRNVA